MKLISVNTGKASALAIGPKKVLSGICKTPRQGGVFAGPLGLEGDEQADSKHHGGPDQAIYLYSAEDYACWSAQLGRELAPGTFGENLTLSGFGPEPLRVGDRFGIGEALLEATAPRIPCHKLAARMGDPGFVKRFRRAGRTGVYTRVLVPGRLQAGDEVRREPATHALLSDFFELSLEPAPDPERVRMALQAPIDARSRRRLTAYLESLQSA